MEDLSPPFLAFFLILLLLVPFIMFLFKKSVSDQPPRLEEAVPYVTNVYQYMTNKKLFLERVA
jgi:hypothetical protein